MKRAILESKPVPLDKEALMDYAGLLADDIIVAAQAVTDSVEQDVDYVSEHDELVRSDYGVNDVKTKEWIPVDIVVSSLVGSVTINDGPLFVDAMVRTDATVPYIEVVLNGAYRWRKLKELRYQLVKELYMNLLHELTHVADLKYRDGDLAKHAYRDAQGEFDDDKYYSDKFEVTAFVQEVSDEALQRAEDFVRSHRNENYTRTQLIDYVSNGRTWKDRVPNLKPTDRARVMKAVYSTLVDAGLI